MSNYRNYCLDPQALTVIATTGDIGRVVAGICTDVKEAAQRENSDHYHIWVQDWKEAYNHLSVIIGSIKKSIKGDYNSEEARIAQIAVNNLRALANSMLNARQWARDHRRARRNPSVEWQH